MEHKRVIGKVGNTHRTRGEMDTHSNPHRALHRAMCALLTRVWLAGYKTCDGARFGFWEGLDWRT